MEERVNNSEDSEFSDDTNQSYDISSENISRPISLKSEEDHCSEDKETERDIQRGTWTKAGIE